MREISLKKKHDLEGKYLLSFFKHSFEQWISHGNLIKLWLRVKPSLPGCFKAGGNRIRIHQLCSYQSLVSHFEDGQSAGRMIKPWEELKGSRL